MTRKLAIAALILGAGVSARATTTTLLDDDFTGSSINTSIWHVNQPAQSTVGTSNGTDLEIMNANPNAGFWGTNAGIWTGFLFNRPTVAGDEVDVTFSGIQLPNALQRFAFGLNSYDASNGQSTFALPDGDGQEDHLSYSFWARPDDSFYGNWIRTKTVNNAAAATAGNGEQMWNSGEIRDFQIRVTSTTVQWWMRIDGVTDWLQVRDPLDTNNTLNYNGSEYGGRSTFGLFVEASSAGASDGVTWDNGDIKIDQILVQSITSAAPIPGDLNGDGTIDSKDLDILVANSGKTMTGGASVGDINGDGVINQDDWALWQVDVANYNAGTSAAPEPASVTLLACGAFALLRYRRRI